MKSIDEDVIQIDNWYREKGRDEVFKEIENTLKKTEDFRNFVTSWATAIGIENIEKIQYRKKGNEEWDYFHLSEKDLTTFSEQQAQATQLFHNQYNSQINHSQIKKNLHKIKCNGTQMTSKKQDLTKH